MSLEHAEARDRKRNKKINGMKVTGRSVFLTQSILAKKAEKAKAKRKKKAGK